MAATPISAEESRQTDNATEVQVTPCDGHYTIFVGDLDLIPGFFPHFADH